MFEKNDTSFFITAKQGLKTFTFKKYCYMCFKILYFFATTNPLQHHHHH